MSKAHLIGCALACAAIAGIASHVHAQVYAGVVGDGIHMQYGPQDADGNYLGIASESYSFYSDFGTGWGDKFPTWSGDQRPPDGVGYGYVLLAFNPYTGEVWNDIPDAHQALSPTSSYTGHAPDVGLTGVDAGGNPISSDVVTADLTRGYDQDCVYITGAFLPRPDDYVDVEPFGSFVQTSSDGGILSVDPWVTYNTAWGAILPEGAEIKEYGASDPDRPADMYADPGGDLDFDQAKVWGFTGFWNWGWGYYAGDVGGVADTLVGFEMDGFKGWMRLDFAGHHTGVRLTEYYFDAPAGRLGDFDGDGDIDADDIDALGAAIQAGSTDTEFDMDGDGDVDSDDFAFHVHNLVDTALGEGTGTAFGDFNLDGLVGILDLGLLGDGYNSTNGWANGDANGDGTIGILDLGLLGDNYGYDGSAIPEPATMSLLGLGAVALLRRRRVRA